MLVVENRAVNVQAGHHDARNKAPDAEVIVGGREDDAEEVQHKHDAAPDDQVLGLPAVFAVLNALDARNQLQNASHKRQNQRCPECKRE